MASVDDTITIRNGSEADESVLLTMLDGTIAWMVARGQERQWGASPASDQPAWCDYVHRWVTGPGLRVAELGDTAVGASVIVARAPDYVPPVPRPETFLLFLMSDRDHAGSHIGEALVRRAAADARSAGSELLRVDCWADAPKLVSWYERQGFVRSTTYTIDDEGDWHGQVFEMEL